MMNNNGFGSGMAAGWRLRNGEGLGYGDGNLGKAK